MSAPGRGGRGRGRSRPAHGPTPSTLSAEQEHQQTTPAVIPGAPTPPPSARLAAPQPALLGGAEHRATLEAARAAGLAGREAALVREAAAVERDAAAARQAALESRVAALEADKARLQQEVADGAAQGAAAAEAATQAQAAEKRAAARTLSQHAEHRRRVEWLVAQQHKQLRAFEERGTAAAAPTERRLHTLSPPPLTSSCAHDCTPPLCYLHSCCGSS